MMTKGQDPADQLVRVDAGLDLRISARPGPVFVQGTDYKIPPEVVSRLREMLTRLVASNQWPQTVAFTSALREEGVSYTAMAVRAALNQDTGQPVCLVDANWYCPSVRVLNTPGLADVVTGTTALRQALTLVWVNENNLMLLPAGRVPQNRRAAAARSPQLKVIITELSRYFTYVILDVPAILATSDAIALAGLADACCMVVRQGVTPVATVRQALGAIGHLPVMGVIMNRAGLHMPTALAGRLLEG